MSRTSCGRPCWCCSPARCGSRAGSWRRTRSASCWCSPRWSGGSAARARPLSSWADTSWPPSRPRCPVGLAGAGRPSPRQLPAPPRLRHQLRRRHEHRRTGRAACGRGCAWPVLVRVRRDAGPGPASTLTDPLTNWGHLDLPGHRDRDVAGASGAGMWHRYAAEPQPGPGPGGGRRLCPRGGAGGAAAPAGRPALTHPANSGARTEHQPRGRDHLARRPRRTWTEISYRWSTRRGRIRSSASQLQSCPQTTDSIVGDPTQVRVRR